MADLDELARALPEVERGEDSDGRPSYSIRGKVFCWHRSPRPDAVDAATCERMEDVLVLWVYSLDEKDLVLADDRGIFFTTLHWNGYRAVLMLIPELARIDREEPASW